jgi:hypothetical protein
MTRLTAPLNGLLKASNLIRDYCAEAKVHADFVRFIGMTEVKQ